MFNPIPLVIGSVAFGVTAWAIDKALIFVSGKDLRENLDAAENKVIQLFPKKEE